MTVKFGVDMSYFLWSVGTGFIFAIFYDLIRVIRKIIKASDLVVNLTDVLILIVCGFVIITEAYFINSGELRVYSVLCLLLVFLLYRLMIGNRLTALIEIFIKYVFNIIKKIIVTAVIPVKTIAGIIVKILKKSHSIKESIYSKITTKKMG